MSLLDVILPKKYKNGKVLFEQMLDQWRTTTEQAFQTANLNFTQIGKDCFGSDYEYNNDGDQSQSYSLQQQIDALSDGTTPITGTSSETFEIKVGGNSSTLTAHELTSPRTHSLPDVSGTFVVTDGAGDTKFVHGSVKIENVGYGDPGTEPEAGIYALTIGGEIYYIPTIELTQNSQITFKAIVPHEYTAGTQLKLRIGLVSDGTAPAFVMSSYFGLIGDDKVLTASMPVQANTSINVAGNATANTEKMDETIVMSDSTGRIGTVAISPGDTIVGKLKRTDATADGFFIVTLEMVW